MIWIMIAGVIVSFVIIIAVYIAGRRIGKKQERIENLEKSIDDAKTIKKNQNTRRNDNINTIRKRMRKYTRN